MNLKNRIDEIIRLDAGFTAFYQLIRNQPNYKVYIKKLLNDPDRIQEANDFVDAIEAKHAEILAKRQVEEQERQDRIEDINQIKKAINLIEESSKPAWEKKLLKRLVKELKVNN